MRLSDLFEIKNGHGLDLTNIEQAPWGIGIAYVSCGEPNNGVTGWVTPIEGKAPAAAGTISVALTGNSVLAAFIQVSPYYTASHMVVLTPKNPQMTFAEKLWWASCVRANRYRFGFGRKADRTIRDLVVPDAAPSWVDDDNTRAAMRSLASRLPSIEEAPVPRLSDGLQRIGDLFDLKYGPSLELVRLKRDPGPTGINFVSRTSQNNGISARVAIIEGLEPDPAGTLSVALGGSVLETFLQPERWYSGRDMGILTPKREMSDAEKLWWASCIRANRYRFNYGRQANRTLVNLMIPKQVPKWVETTPHIAVEELRDSVVGIAASVDEPSGLQKTADLMQQLFRVKPEEIRS